MGGQLTTLQAIPETRLKIDGAVTLSFHRAAEFGDGEHIDYVFPLFPRKGLNALFPSIEGKAEHYCAFALPEHGSITFRCNLNNSLKEYAGTAKYDKFSELLDGNPIRVKAYYPILHTLKSFGSKFSFKDTDLATCPSVRKVFDSFLFMAERIDWWGKYGVLRPPEQRILDRIDTAKFKKEISCLRIEASFVLDVPDKKLDGKVVMTSMESLLERDVNMIFGHDGGTKRNILTSSLDFMVVNDWLEQVRKVREMLTREADEGETNFSLRPGWRMITSRGKQQAECLQSLLGYCCKRTNQSARSRLWGLVWNTNAEEEYPGMGDGKYMYFCLLLTNIICFFSEIASYWEQKWDWYNFEKRKDIKKDEWKHVRWFYDNCNWRTGWARGTFAVTSKSRGIPTGIASDPCESLYKLLMVVRENEEVESEKEWEEVYQSIVKRGDQVMRKGKEPRKKPNIVNWPK